MFGPSLCCNYTGLTTSGHHGDRCRIVSKPQQNTAHLLRTVSVFHEASICPAREEIKTQEGGNVNKQKFSLPGCQILLTLSNNLTNSLNNRNVGYTLTPNLTTNQEIANKNGTNLPTVPGNTNKIKTKRAITVKTILTLLKRTRPTKTVNCEVLKCGFSWIMAGCTISPLAFTMTLEIFIRTSRLVVGGERLSSGMRHDMTTMTTTAACTNRLLGKLTNNIEWARMQFKPSKSMSILIVRYKTLFINGEAIPSVSEKPCSEESWEMVRWGKDTVRL